MLVSALIAGGDTTFGAAMVNLLLTTFISGLLAVGIIRRRPYRQQVLLCGIVTAIANIVIILTIGFMTNTSVADVFANALWSAGQRAAGLGAVHRAGPAGGDLLPPGHPG